LNQREQRRKLDRILLTYVEEMSSSSSRKRRLKAAALIAAKQQADDPDSTDLVLPDEDGAAFEERVSRSAAPLAPVRDCHKLFAVTTTLDCAWTSGCVPCAYKIATFDVALDFSFCKRIPNQRPELCPRCCRPSTAATITTNNYTAGADVTARTGAGVPPRTTAPPPVSIPGLYRPTMRVLTVGDGDFSFSLALARFGCHVTATSYETKETVVRVYESIGVEATLSELEKGAGCSIAFSVDATNLRETLPVLDGDDQQQFDRIVWNFPCSAVTKGQDGQNQEMEHNKELVRRFVDNASNFLSSNGHGQIHINHKTKPPFNQWKLEEVAMSAAPNNVRYLGRVVLDRCLFPPYVPRKALDRKSFPCHDACTYIFDVVQDNTTNATTTTTTRNPLDDMTISDPLKVLVENKVLSSSSSKGSLVAITPVLIQSLRARFLQQRQDEARHVSTVSRKKGRRRR